MKNMLFLIILVIMPVLGASETSPTEQAQKPGVVLEVPGFLNRARAYWEDLDADGKTDIWVTDADGELWVCDGNGTTFEKLEYEVMGMDAKPAKTPHGWRVRTYHDGQILEYHPQTGWFIAQDLNNFTRIRPGMKPISGGLPLVPTFDGYWMMDGPCAQQFKVLPAIELDKRRLKLSYARPQWTHLNDDGAADLMAPPLHFAQHSQIRIWSALRDGQQWLPSWSSLEFPSDLKIESSQTGDLDNDGIDDLVILGKPAGEMSFLDELSFVVYLGEGPGKWSPTPIQVLKTKQNLWQTGPIEVDKRGILLYYYKGLIRSHFRMDRYRWDPNGFINPKPATGKWTLKDAERDMINLDFDLDNDGLKDMILQDEEALRVYFRKDGDLPFAEKRTKELAASSGNPTLTITISPDEVSSGGRMSLRMNTARGHNSLALVNRNQEPALWRFSRKKHGHWLLTRIL